MCALAACVRATSPGLACLRLLRVARGRLRLPEGWYASGCHASPGLARLPEGLRASGCYVLPR
eukprot:6049846-Alexandrium_andersonii.AAC.1